MFLLDLRDMSVQKLLRCRGDRDSWYLPYGGANRAWIDHPDTKIFADMKRLRRYVEMYVDYPTLYGNDAGININIGPVPTWYQFAVYDARNLLENQNVDHINVEELQVFFVEPGSVDEGFLTNGGDFRIFVNCAYLRQLLGYMSRRTEQACYTFFETELEARRYLARLIAAIQKRKKSMSKTNPFTKKTPAVRPAVINSMQMPDCCGMTILYGLWARDSSRRYWTHQELLLGLEKHKKTRSVTIAVTNKEQTAHYEAAFLEAGFKRVNVAPNLGHRGSVLHTWMYQRKEPNHWGNLTEEQVKDPLGSVYHPKIRTDV
jgi:hypothetical protein